MTTPPRPTNSPLEQALVTAKLLVMVGSGGVGKTTTSAALAVQAAQRGRRVLVLTIDPAMRLLQALGLHGQGLAPNVPHEVLPKRLEHLPENARDLHGGSLHALMLDAESGAVAMVERLLPDPKLRDQVLNNRIYRAFLPTLSASPDYMALELIQNLMEGGQFDLVVLDTPPMHNALDFLRAGGTLSAFINDRVLKWFSKVPMPGQKSRFAFLNAGTSVAMTLLGKLFGQETLPDIAQFFASFQEVLPRLKARAQQTDRLLRAPGTRFVIVTAPGETSLREAKHLHHVLLEQGVPFGGFVVNRVVQVPGRLQAEAHDTAELAGRLTHLGMGRDKAEALADRLVHAASRLRHLGTADEAHVTALQRQAGPAGFCTVVPQQESDLQTLAELHGLGGLLLDGLRPSVVPS